MSYLSYMRSEKSTLVSTHVGVLLRTNAYGCDRVGVSHTGIVPRAPIIKGRPSYVALDMVRSLTGMNMFDYNIFKNEQIFPCGNTRFYVYNITECIAKKIKSFGSIDFSAESGFAKCITGEYSELRFLGMSHPFIRPWILPTVSNVNRNIPDASSVIGYEQLFNNEPSPKEARKLYLKLMVANHPDKGGNPEKTKMIVSAYGNFKNSS